MSQYEIPDKYQLMWRFRTNSMFDLANYYSTKPVLLDEHFRSFAPIIDFSNKEFYGDRIRIMSQCNDSNVLEFVEVPEGKVDMDITRNMPEVEAIMQRLQEIIQDDERNNKEDHEPVTVGIISPFRGQVELIKKAIAQWCGYYAFTDISNIQIKRMDSSINYQIRKHKLNMCKVNMIDVLFKTRKHFDDLRDQSLVPWCIACVPTTAWAKELFPESEDAFPNIASNKISLFSSSLYSGFSTVYFFINFVQVF